MKEKTKLIVSLTINSIIIALEIAGLVLSIIDWGFAMFQFYTQDSNYLALVVCIIYEVFAIKKLANKSSEIPHWVNVLQYLALCALMLTFLVVICVLIPMSGIKSLVPMLFSGSMLFHHLLCPILMAVSFFFFEITSTFKPKEILFAMIFTAMYAVVIIILNLAKVLIGPYPFLRVYEQPVYMSIIWTAVILGMALLIAFLVYILKNRIERNNLKTKIN